jgi:hypothetical protein
MEIDIRENGRMIKEMVKVINIGQTATVMKEIG